jgi:hypothetical protein
MHHNKVYGYSMPYLIVSDISVSNMTKVCSVAGLNEQPLRYRDVFPSPFLQLRNLRAQVEHLGESCPWPHQELAYSYLCFSVYISLHALP